jgi:hypothetical protein
LVIIALKLLAGESNRARLDYGEGFRSTLMRPDQSCVRVSS